jgi:hypothetical protein
MFVEMIADNFFGFSQKRIAKKRDSLATLKKLVTSRTGFIASCQYDACSYGKQGRIGGRI